MDKPTTTLTLDADQVRALFATFDVAMAPAQAFHAGEWTPRPSDALPAVYLARMLKGASLEREMKQLHVWLKRQEPKGGTL